MSACILEAARAARAEFQAEIESDADYEQGKRICSKLDAAIAAEQLRRSSEISLLDALGTLLDTMETPRSRRATTAWDAAQAARAAALRGAGV